MEGGRSRPSADEMQVIHCLVQGKAVTPRYCLMPYELLEKLPKLYATEDVTDPVVQVKYFYPAFGWTWYGIEFDGQDIMFGLVDGFEKELGYFSLRELAQTRDQLGLKVERDLYFIPKPLSDVRK
jgi:hypothetical protein